MSSVKWQVGEWVGGRAGGKPAGEQAGGWVGGRAGGCGEVTG